jgi:hypothetical protein
VKIKTSYVHPPIPIRDFDWCAYDDNTYDGPGSLLGEGPTEKAAIADLLRQMDEEDEEMKARFPLLYDLTDHPKDYRTNEEPEQLRLTEEDKRLADHAAAIFADSEIRAKWGFPSRRLQP